LKGREEREECVRKIQLKGYAEGATDNLNAVFDAVMAGV
jgi:hypothetical protein